VKVPIKSIKIEKSDDPSSRARCDFGDISKMVASIKEHGFLHPLLVTKLDEPDGNYEYILICGERRLRAAILAGLSEVPVTTRENVTPDERKAMELEENLVRKDFTWHEQIECLKQLHDLRQQIYGPATHAKDSKGWGARQTAEILGKSLGSIGMDLKLAQDLRDNPELLKRVRNIPKIPARKIVKQAIEAKMLRKLVDDKEIDIGVDLRLGNCCTLIDELADNSVDCLLTDPPFANPGILATGVTDKATYNVTESNVSNWEVMLGVYKVLIPKLAKKLKIGAHVYMFCGMGEIYCTLMSLFKKSGFLMDDLPIIWHKERVSTIAKDFHYVSCYEACIFGHNGARTRSLWKPVANLIAVPAIAGQLRVHPLQRPDELLRIMIENSTSVGQLVLDCFAGSGSTLKVARDLQRNAIGFELNEGNYLRAMAWLREKQGT
jgi:site-specific DNA-methyltransferase (adenine-specific)